MAEAQGFTIIKHAISTELAQEASQALSDDLKARAEHEKFFEYEITPISSKVASEFIKVIGPSMIRRFEADFFTASQRSP